MQIVVNTRLLLQGKLDGMGWFSYQTLKRITQQNKEVHFVFLFDRPFSESFIFSDNVTPLVLSPPARHPFLYYYWLQFSVKPLLQKMKPDLFLSPDGLLPLGVFCKQLPVIHDINFVHHPQDIPFFSRKYYNYFFPKFAKQATRIATVSEYSKKDIAQTFGINPQKIDVVYNGINDFFDIVSEETKTATKKKYTQSCDYFVFVGSLHPRKNIVRLLKAFALFKKRSQASVKMVLAGSVFWGEQDMQRIVAENKLQSEVVFTGRVSNEILKNLIGSALALTYVPYFEGFGIPLIEAMQCGTPILAARSSCLPEIAEGAALYANPFDEQEIMQAMLALYEDADLRADLIQKGSLQKNKYSWDKTASLLWESIEKTMENDAAHSSV
ncbi:MAG: glycosyltransferase family 4 protein [Bacteroidetes bacterium]|nr:glycosyltransferase family 4 protein [Bacteroidota bacterium]